MIFEELNLHKQVLEGIKNAKFVQCLPVQEKVLPITLEGNDVMVQSKTGSGKTAVFVITFLEEFLRKKENNVSSKCLIVAPTRELALQIADDAKVLCSAIEGFRIGCFYGGVGYETQRKALKKGCDLIVGTPGRLIDFMSSGELDASELDTFVIDEADRLFDMGFYPDLKKIFRRLPDVSKRQTMLFSATLEMKVRELAWEYMSPNCKEVELEGDSVTVDKITQELYHVAKSEKFKLLLQILKSENASAVLIFTNLRHLTSELSARLALNGYKANYLAGNLPQNQRQKALDSLKNGKIQILIATDVAARGLQINDLPLVINYDIPEDYENYVHRIGRTARAGKSGKAISLADEEFVYGLEAIEKYIKMKIPVVWPNFEDIEDLSLGKNWDTKPEKKVIKKTDSGKLAPLKTVSNKESAKLSHMKSLGKMTQEERIEYYREKYGFVPKEDVKKQAKNKADKKTDSIKVKPVSKPVGKTKGRFITVLPYFVPALIILMLHFAIGTIPSLILRIFGKKKASLDWCAKNARIVSYCLLKMLGADIEITGCIDKVKDAQGVVYVANHCSMLDVLLVLYAMHGRLGFIAKQEIVLYPFVNLTCVLLNCVFINRFSLKGGANAILRGIKRVKNGWSMLVFPEGSRSKDSKVAPFRRGSFRLATEAQADIVPLIIKNDRILLENRTRVFEKQIVKLCVLDRVSTEAKNHDELYYLEKKIEEDIRKKYERL